MSAILERFSAAGITFATGPDGKLRAFGHLTDEQRVDIRTNKAAILAALMTERELRRLIPLVLRDAPNEHDLVTRTALADAQAALMCFRALAAEQGLLS